MNLKKRLFIVLIMICFLALEFYVADRSLKAQENEFHGIIPAKDTLYLWYTDEDLTEYLNSAALDYYEQTDVRIVPRLTSALEYLEQINEASLKGVEIPDLYIIGNESLEKAYLAGLASVVTDPLGKLNLTNYPSTALNAITYKDKKVAYPYYFQTSIFVYNKTYLKDSALALVKAELEGTGENNDEFTELTEEEIAYLESEGTAATNQEDSTTTTISEEEIQLLAEEKMESMIPKTIDDILTMANEYDAPENVEVVFKWDNSDIFYNYFMVGNYISVGGETGDDASNISIYNKNAIECLKVYQNLNSFFSLSTEEVVYQDVVQDFIDGKVVMTVATTDMIQKLEDAKAQGNFQYEYEVTTLPDISATYQSRGLSVTNALVVNGYCDNKSVANAFAQYLTFERGENLYARSGKIATKSSVEYENSQINACLQEYARSISIPKMLETSNYWVALEITFDKIWSGENVNLKLKELSEQIMTQVTGEAFVEETIVE